MKNTLIPSVLMLATMMAAHAEDKAKSTEAATPAVESKEEKAAPAVSIEVARKHFSYGVGFQSGLQFAQQAGQAGIGAEDFSGEDYLKGFLTGFKNAKPEVQEEDFRAAMQTIQASVQKREAAIGKENAEKGKAFLAENGKKEGVVTTKSGLQYTIINKGGTEKYQAPKDGKDADKVFKVNYRGTLLDGTEFDKSPEGKPVSMPLQVVPGFKEALTTMPVGAKWKLFIPSDLAYGEQRRGPHIAPNSTLIFDLELVGIEDAPKAPAGGPEGGFPTPEGGAPNPGGE